jgi:hypothetical protein
MEVWNGLQSSGCPFLNFFSKIVRDKKIMNIALIALKVLVVRSDRSILVILRLYTAFC